MAAGKRWGDCDTGAAEAERGAGVAPTEKGHANARTGKG